jgi:RNA polymerase sigma factor for flagellar operon FliA
MAETPMTEEEVEAFRTLVDAIARGIWRGLNTQLRRRHSYNDLCQIGWIGLLEAWPKFDPDRGVRVSTFVSWRVYGVIIDTLRREDPLSQARRQLYHELDFLREQLRQKSGHEPELETIAHALNFSEDQVRTLLGQAAIQEVPLDAIPEPAGAPAQEMAAGQRALADAVSACVQALQPHLSRVIRLRYTTEPRLTYEAIGEILGLPQATAVGWLQQAYARIRQCLRQRGWEMSDLDDDVEAVAKLLALPAADRQEEP